MSLSHWQSPPPLVGVSRWRAEHRRGAGWRRSGCGSGAVLSHAAAHGDRQDAGRYQCAHAVAAVSAHRASVDRIVMQTASRSRRRSGRWSTWPRQLAPAALERVVNEADRLDLVDPGGAAGGARRATAASGASRGCGRCSIARTFRLTDSELERRFLPLVAAGGPAGAADAAAGQRLRGRLLLARARPRRRDRRPALPPHAGPAGAGPACATRRTPPPA